MRKRAMTEATNSIRKALLPVFEKYRDNVLFGYLFGSAARGDSGPLSDLDIAVYFAGSRGDSFFDESLSLYADLCRALKSNEVDLLVLNSATNLMILEDVVRHGVILYERGPESREEFEVRTLHSAIDFRKQRLAAMGM